MELHKAIKEIVSQRGVEMISNIQIINFLLDYQAFKEKPATKFVLRDVINARYAEALLALNDVQTRQTKLNQYKNEIINTYGYQEDLVSYVFDSIVFGLGLQDSFEPQVITQQIAESELTKESESTKEPELVTYVDKLKDQLDSYQDICSYYKLNKSDSAKYSADRNGVLYSTDKRALVSKANFKGTSYAINAGTQYIADDAWKKDSFDMEALDLLIPDTVEALGSFSFYFTRIKHLNIPASVKYIGPYAFEFCDFSQLTTHNGLEYIERSAFEYTNITRFTIVETVKYIGYNALPNGIEVINNSKYLSVRNGLIFDNEEKYLMSSFSKTEELDLPDSLEVIGPDVFLGNEYLKKVSTGSNLKRICDYGFCACKNLIYILISGKVNHIGEGAFSGCSNLSSIVSLSPRFEVVDKALYDKEEKRLIAYYGKETIFQVKPGTKTIGISAFEGATTLQRVILPESVSLIKSWAFADCDNLKEIRLYNSNCIIENNNDITLVRYC